MAKMLRLKDICENLSVSKSHVRRLVSDAGFPPPVKLGPRASAWPAAEVDAWVSRRIEESRRDAQSDTDHSSAPDSQRDDADE